MDNKLNEIILDELLEPIDGTIQSGTYLRFTNYYDDILYAFSEENPNLEQGLWQHPLKKADWRKTKSLCISALKEKTKDIQIANWLLSSLIHLYGFRGLSFGLEFIFRLTSKFWETIHPQPVEGDKETRLAPYYWLEEKFYIQLRLLPFTLQFDEKNAFTLDKWERETKPSDPNYETVYERFKEQVFISGEEFFKDIEKEITLSIDTAKRLKDFLLNKDNSAPHLIQFISTIESIKSVVDIALNEIKNVKKLSLSTNDNEKEASGKPDDLIEQPQLPSAGFIPDLNYAYKLLDQTADFLIKNEPEKITGYLVKNAALLRNSALRELLRRNIKNDNMYSEIIGILNIE